MKFALYLGCTIQTEQYAYELSTREVFQRLGVELIDIEGSSCCGYPIKSVSDLGWIYLSARNLALTEELGISVLPLCNGCHISLCEVKQCLAEDANLKRSVDSLLSIEGLKYTGKTRIVHILEVLRDVIGIEKVRRSVYRPLEGLRLATHYGCHAIRPSKLGRPDNPEDPRTLEELTEALGAETEEYPERLDCCGQGLAISSGKTALSIAGVKLKAIRGHGFDGIVTICPFCMKMFDSKQKAIGITLKEKDVSLPVLYYTQLLGLAMGIDFEKLGLDLNLSPVGELFDKLEGEKNGKNR